MKADAGLIAAAPDLLAFAEQFILAVGDSIHDQDHDGPDEPRCTLDNPLCLEMTARAAIRKATAA